MKTMYTLLVVLVFMITSVFATEVRVCPPCPYHPCPTDFVTLIKKDVTISVPGVLPIAPFIQVDTIQDALNALESYKIVNGATVTIQLTQNVDNYDTINITHPDGDKIHIIGNCSGSSCTAQFKPGSTGVFVTNRHFLGLLDNFTLVGNSVTGAHGIWVTQNSGLVCGPKVTVQHFDNGVFAENNSYIAAPSIQSTYNSNGIVATNGSTANVPYAIANYNRSDGIFANYGAVIMADNAQANNNENTGIDSDENSTISAIGALSKNNYASGFRTQSGAYIRAQNTQSINNCSGGAEGCGQFEAIYNSFIFGINAVTQGVNPVTVGTGGRVCYVNGSGCVPS